MNEPHLPARGRRARVPSVDERGAAMLARWDRIGIAVRCGYNPTCGCLARLYLLAARRVVELEARDELTVQYRSIEVLLQTARDEALPWLWRSVCLEHTAMPLARLTSLLRHHDPIACDAIHAAVQAAGDVANAWARRAASLDDPGS